MKNQIGKSLVKMIALALAMACTQSAAAQHFKQVSVTGGANLVQIAAGGKSVWARAVGGGNAVKGDTVWGLDSSGRIYHATASGTAWVFSQVPGVLDFIAVGIGYQEVCHPTGYYEEDFWNQRLALRPRPHLPPDILPGER